MNNKIIGIVVMVAVVASIGFYGGMKYQLSKAPVRSGQFGGARNGQLAQVGQRGGIGNGFVAGEVLSKDDNSITVKLPGGNGTSIVFYSPTTIIEKAASGSWSDVAVGTSVVIRGTQNADNTYTAQSVQLARPMMMRPGGSPFVSPK